MWIVGECKLIALHDKKHQCPIPVVWNGAFAILDRSEDLHPFFLQGGWICCNVKYFFGNCVKIEQADFVTFVVFSIESLQKDVL